MENTDSHQQHLNQVTLMGMLVAVGIVFGDIGASPLYTFSAVIGSKPVEPLAKEDVYYIRFTPGFRIEPRINYFFELVPEELVKNREVERTSRRPALQKYDVPGDLRFVLSHSFLSYENDLSFGQNFVLRAYYFLRRWLSIREDEAFGLDASNVVIENAPLVVSPLGNAPLKREF